MRGWIEFLAPIISILGLVLNVGGMYLLLRWYQPYKPAGFFGLSLRVTGLLLARKKAEAVRITNEAISLARLRKVEQSESLIGLYLVVIGLVLQTAGAICWALDTFWTRLHL